MEKWNEFWDKVAALVESRPRLAGYVIFGSIILGFIGWLI